MERMCFLLNLSMSGIKNIEKEIRIDFYGKNVNKSSSFDSYSIKAIYGENGSGKTAIITAVSIVKSFVIDDNYLSDPRNLEILKALINKKTRKFRFRCEFITNIEKFYIHEYEVCFEIDRNDELYVTYESLKERINSSKNAQKTIFCSEMGEFSALNLSEDSKNTIIEKTKNLLTKRSAILSMANAFHKESPSKMPYELVCSFIFFISLYTHLDADDSHTYYYHKSRIRKLINDDMSDDSKMMKSFLKEIYYEIKSTERKVPIESFDDYKRKIKKLESFVRLFKPTLKKIDIDKTVNKEVYECKLIMNYGSYSIDSEFESTGIKRIMNMFNAFGYASNYGIVFIDELDSNINGVYLNKLIEYFINYGKGQLCFTSHNTEPMAILKQNNKAIDFLSNDNRIVPWVKNGHYTPDKSYINGMIEGLPFNIDSSDFISVFSWEGRE